MRQQDGLAAATLTAGPRPPGAPQTLRMPGLPLSPQIHGEKVLYSGQVRSSSRKIRSTRKVTSVYFLCFPRQDSSSGK